MPKAVESEMLNGDRTGLIELLIDITRCAAEAILDVYESDFDVTHKSDSSPVTDADRAAHAIIEAGLQPLGLPILSEESPLEDYSVREHWSKYWLVDPLDGTREFIKKNGEFSVNIALIDNHCPVLGVIGLPVGGDIYWGDTLAGKAFKLRGKETALLRCPAHDSDRLTVLTSRSHVSESLAGYLARLNNAAGSVTILSRGSSLKLCLIAEGRGDVYPKIGPTSEWDIAAGQAILEAAGGAVELFHGGTLSYNTRESLINPDFYAKGDNDIDWGRYYIEPNA